MSSTLLEVTRSKHEQVERFERLIIKDFENEPTSDRERLFQDHRVRNVIEAVTSSTENLIEIYQDNDSARKDEIAALGAQTAAGTGIEAALSAFYDGLKEIHEYHKRHPYSRALEESDQELLLKEEPHVEFSGEEEPLQDLDRLFSKVETDFKHLWEDGKKSKGLENGSDVSSQNSIDLVDYSTVDELVTEVAGNREKEKELKKALSALGLKSGGTVQQLAERLFLTKHMPVEQLDKKHFVNGAAASQDTELKEIALKELKMKRLCEMLKETIQQTKENVQRKQALTADERQKEIDEEDIRKVKQVDIDSDDEEEQKIYNPLKLPMGWDNKPIPYWLYRLHGLGQEFKCEICGDQSYWGRRVFERHFNEPLHQRGMRRLGIPNTKSFREVTSIQEAKALWEKIQARQKEKKWLPDLEEEYEDREGNIYNKKVYNELRRQELIV
ncbi:splicing factor SF3a60 homolog [Papaver somniferum]|uniref:splicing factor SF3a60 homolog n=1 Tax=Papaver somniferum TaxID=3469 RepID=UPI000E704C3E|nr:splicing factor SF3a60 homolog [Papaver somniferum]